MKLRDNPEIYHWFFYQCMHCFRVAPRDGTYRCNDCYGIYCWKCIKIHYCEDERDDQ